jgi:hypothetical protein
MPDWNELVREHLGVSEPSSAEHVEVIAELSGHLEDLYAELRRKGLGEPEAVKQALGDRANWRGLAKKIRRAKSKEEILNHRTKTLWWPGLVSLTASMSWLMILQRVGPQPRMPWLHSGLPLMPYLVWLGTQPLLGATSAYMSRRAGGDRLTELTSTLFPSIVMLGLWCLVVAISILVEKNPHVLPQWPLVLFGAFVWAIFPGLLVLLGRLLSLRTHSWAKS